MMSYPSLGDYQAAIQHPRIVLTDPALAACSVELTPLGMPKARSGGFAVTYQLIDGKRTWAVRCFHRDVADLEERYRTVSAYLAKVARPLFLPFEYQAHGIAVGKARYPIVKMEWGTGDTLGLYLDRHHRDANRVSRLAERFRQAMSELESLGIAHGDLQHGNILASDAKLLLIDYDGMFVPGMRATNASDLGHVNYQSPLRSGRDFGPHLDRFSAICIDLSLQALIVNPGLWDRYYGGENLLFQRRDILDPLASPLIAELHKLPGIADSVQQFLTLARVSLARLPSLDAFISGQAQIVSSMVDSVSVSQPIRLHQYDIINAADADELRSRVGDRVQVVGHVVEVARMSTRYGRPYAFINFGDWRNGSFRLVLWEQALQALSQGNLDLDRLEGSWLTFTGLIDEYRRGVVRVPQITVDDPSELTQVSGEGEAQQLLHESTANFATIGRASPPFSAPSNARETHNQQLREQLLKRQSTRSQPPSPPRVLTPPPATFTPFPPVQPSSTPSANDAVRAALQQRSKTPTPVPPIVAPPTTATTSSPVPPTRSPLAPSSPSAQSGNSSTPQTKGAESQSAWPAILIVVGFILICAVIAAARS